MGQRGANYKHLTAETAKPVIACRNCVYKPRPQSIARKKESPLMTIDDPLFYALQIPLVPFVLEGPI